MSAHHREIFAAYRLRVCRWPRFGALRVRTPTSRVATGSRRPWWSRYRSGCWHCWPHGFAITN